MREKRLSARQYDKHQDKVFSTESTSMLQSIPNPVMLVEGLIPQGAIIMVAAPNHSGKTFFAVELARALALNVPFMGHYPVKEPQNTLFIEQDAPKIDAGRVIWAMIRGDWEPGDPEWDRDQPLEAMRFAWHMGIDLWNGLDCRKIINTANKQSFLQGYHNQGGEPIYDQYGDEIGTEEFSSDSVSRDGVKLIVYDSFRSMHTAEENDSGEMEAIMQDLKYIRAETGATQLILHHENAGGERPRGSTAIEAAMDMIFRLKRTHGTNLVTCDVSKARIIQPESFKYEIISDEDEHGHPVKSVRWLSTIETKGSGSIDPNTITSDHLAAYIKTSIGAKHSAILDWGTVNGVSRSTINRWLKRLKEIEQIRAERDGDGTKYFSA